MLYCTTDGTTPTASSPKCAEPTTVFKTQFLQAIAVAPGKDPSAVGSAAYTIDLTAAATPTFSPAGGSYTSAQQVTISDATAGVNIYYTTDGSVPTASSTLYAGPVSVSSSETLTAVAVASGYTNSGIASASYSIGQTVPAPAFSVPTGNYPSAQTVTITDADPNALIFYAMNGATPSASSTPYTGAITVAQTETISAIAIDGSNNSSITTVAYSIGLMQTVPAPVFSPASGSTVSAGQTVTILDGDANAAIYYTLDGSTPSASSIPYPLAGIPLSTPGSVTINAIAIDTGTSSMVATAAYTVTALVVPIPTFSPASGGAITSGMAVTILDGDANAAIYYTADGSTPSSASTPYPSGGITLSTTGSVTIKAIAIDSGTSSAVGTATYTVSPSTVPAPTFTPASGSTVTAGKTVMIADSDAKASIYYTTDGSTPSASSMLYTSGGVTLSTTGSATINAIAIDSGTSSTVSTATYTVAPATVATPTFSPASGSVAEGQSVIITDTDTKASIYYTTDGSTPSSSSTPYPVGGVVLSTPGSASLKAIAIDSGTSSTVATATYTVTATSVPPPTFTPASGSTFPVGQTVTIADGDAKAKIYYTTDGSTPSASSTLYASGGFAITTTGSVTVKAIAIDGANSSAVVTAAYTVAPTSVATPAFSPASGSTVPEGQTVTISDSDTKASIYYTTNGTAPSASSTPYPSGGIKLSTPGNVTIEAIAIDTGTSSSVATATYIVSAPAVAAPTFSPASGTTLTSGEPVTIADTDTKASIYYTIDGSTPSASSNPYPAGGIVLTTPGSTTIKAIAIDSGTSSPVSSATYTVPASVAAPTFSPASGTTLTSGEPVTIADTDTKASIYYTTDGSTPSAASKPYPAGGIVLTAPGSTTIKAIAIDSGTSSPVSSATYTVPSSVPAPMFSPATGSTVTVGGTVTITDGDASATVYYTEDGSTPTASSPKYTAPITLSKAGTVTINAIAIDAGSDSAVGSATYTVMMAASGPTVSGIVMSGTSPVDGAQVQLYAAGQTGYGSNGTALGAAVTTGTTGAFTATFSSCPASPGDLVYAVVTGGNAGKGVNASLEMMTALGPCSKLSSTATYMVNEVTTVASAYALSPFMTTAPNVGSSSTNYAGLSNAFGTVNNLASVTSGSALSITPAYATNTVAFLNSSTAPQARVNTLANILNACVDSAGASGGCSNLFSAATPTGGATPTNTLQAILDIAQNPGEKVSTLFGLASSPAPFKPGLTSAPNDFTLALTFTGGGLGINPAVMDGTLMYAGTAYTGVGPTQNSAMAIDATGNIWVTAGGFDYTDVANTAPLLAEFNNLGAPLTPATKLSAANPPAVTYGGFNPENTNSTSLGVIAIDQSGNNWVSDTSSSGDLFEITPALSIASSQVLGELITSEAIDANSAVWDFASSLNVIANGKVTTLNVPNGDAYANQLNDLTFDANGGLWGSDEASPNSGAPDIYQMSLTNGSVSFDAFPSGGAYTTTAADGAGNIYGCGDTGGQTLDVFNSAAIVNSFNLTTTRGCGGQLLLDGLGHLFAVSNGYEFPPAMAVDEFSTTGKLISPAANGFTGTSSAEPVTINADPNYFGYAQGTEYLSGTAAIDGSGNLWVLNPDTNGPTTPGNVLVEFVGLAAPVVTPTSVAVTNGSLGLRP